MMGSEERWESRMRTGVTYASAAVQPTLQSNLEYGKACPSQMLATSFGGDN